MVDACSKILLVDKSDPCYLEGGGGGGGGREKGSHIKVTGVVIIPIRGLNFVVWHR